MWLSVPFQLFQLFFKGYHFPNFLYILLISYNIKEGNGYTLFLIGTIGTERCIVFFLRLFLYEACYNGELSELYGTMQDNYGRIT